jgi:hypothetical protein
VIDDASGDNRHAEIATAKVEEMLPKQSDDSFHPGFGKSEIV